MNESFVAADVNCTSQGTPSLACITAWTLMPPFFLPVFGCRPTPLKMALENKLTVVESMIRSRFIHSSVPLRRLSDERMSLLASYSHFPLIPTIYDDLLRQFVPLANFC